MARVNEKRVSTRGFTLVETLVATALSGILLAAVLSTFIYLGRSGATTMHYTDIQLQSRRIFSQFGMDARQASGAQWSNTTTLVLTVNGASVTYAYSTTTRQFTRASGGTTQVIASNVSGFTFKAFNIAGTELPLATSHATVGDTTKMIQVQMLIERNPNAAASSSENALSAKFMLRNKVIS